MSNDTTEIYEPVELFFSIYACPEAEVSDLTPVICVHGLLSSNRTWNAVRYKLSEKTKRKVYAIDLRNHGKSSKSSNYRIEYHIADLENWMVSQGIPRAVFIAHSLGGKIAMGLALKKPEMVEALMINDIQIKDTEDHAKQFTKMAMFINFIKKIVNDLPLDTTEAQAKEKLRPILERAYPKSKSDKLTLPFEKSPSGKFIWETNVEVIFGPKTSVYDYSLDLSSVVPYNGKALFVAAEDSDVKMLDDKDNILKIFPNSTVRTVKNVFHSFHVEFPEDFIKMASEFINAL